MKAHNRHRIGTKQETVHDAANDTAQNTEPKFELQQFFGESMDRAVSSALKSWDEFVSQYPGQTIDKKFLVNNISLIHRLLEAVIPNVLQDNAVLEDQYQQVLESYEIQNHKHLQDLIAVSGSINVTVSSIETLGELNDVLDRLSAYGIFMEMSEDIFQKDALDASKCGTELDEDVKLASPFWLICALLPNDTLSPHLVPHSEYVVLMRGCKNVKHVDLEEAVLMKSSEVVDDLLKGLGLE